MAFYNEEEEPYLTRGMLGVGLRASPLQVKDDIGFPKSEAPDNATLLPIAVMSNSLTCTEICYSSIERETLHILYGLEKFHHSSFIPEVSSECKILML